MGIYSNDNGGIVFTSATADWARVLAINKDPNVDHITRNVLDNLQTCQSTNNWAAVDGSTFAVVGRVAKFYVDSSTLPDIVNPKYQSTYERKC